MSERTRNREMEDEEMARASKPAVEERYEEEDWIDSESDWRADEGEELPPRPRSRLRRPLPIALLTILIASLGFLGGVLVQRGSGEGGSAGAIAGGELPTFLSGEGGELSGGEGGGLPGGSGSAVTGTVTGVKGRTIYVKDADGNTVAVRAGDGSTVTRDAEVGVKAVHPGDTVVVEGSKKGSTVKASSVAATEAGVESATGGFPAAAVEEGGGGTVESLFGE